MAGDLPPAPGDRAGVSPPGPTQWAPVFPTQSQRRSSTWPSLILAGVATVVAVAALVVALTRSSTPVHSPATTAPTNNAAVTANPHQQLCDVYSRAARAVQIESNGGGTALARIATVNGAAMLEATATVPGLKPDERSAALALARSYRDLTAIGSVVNGSSDPAWQSAIGDVNAADSAMKKVCEGS